MFRFLGIGLSNLCAPVEVDVLSGEQFDGHVVDGGHFLLHDNCIEECGYACESLHIGMLSHKERDAALLDAFYIFGHHVVAHNLYVAAVAP